MQLRAAVARRLPTGVKRLAGRLRRARQTLEFRIWNALNGREGHKLISVYGSHRMAIDVADFRAYRIWRLGGSQSEKVRMIAALCDAKPALFIDVGANYGEFSVIPAALGVRCIAVEPNPRVCACLRETFAGKANVSVVEAVASNRGGSAIFFFCDAATGSGSLARDIPAGEARDFSASTHERNVRSVILDELAGDTEPVRARGLVLKIDVEGFEKEVLEGAAGLVGRAAWWRALLEFSPSCLRSANKDIAETWRFFRRYAGTVLDPASATEAVDLGMLPEEPPLGEVELLVGAGRLPAPCAHP